MRVLAGALVAGVVLAAGFGVDAFAQTAGKLGGTWVAVSAERNGKPADELRGHRLTFAGDTFVIRRDGQMLYKGTFKTDPTKKPAQIDFRQTEGEAKGKTWRGIYLLEGDTLKAVDNAPDTKKPRPAQFTTKPDSGHVMLTFKRVP
jgi:uncharacterized protein (TIGR03067 family)